MEESRVPLTRAQRLWIAGIYYNLCNAVPQCPVPVNNNINELMDLNDVPTHVDQLSHNQLWVLDLSQ